MKREPDLDNNETIIENPDVKNKINLILSGLGSNSNNFSGSLVLSYNNIFQHHYLIKRNRY